jgi:hypothetical protein
MNCQAIQKSRAVQEYAPNYTDYSTIGFSQ